LEIKKEEILKALNTVKPGLSGTTLLAQMESIMFTGTDIITYNDQICVLYPFETDFEAAINHKDLLKVVNKISTETFKMELNENEVRVKAKGTKAGFNVVLENEISEKLTGLLAQLPDAENGKEWKDLPAEFMKGALLCLPAASTNQSQGVLTCLYTNGKDLICSDNQRVSWFEMNTDLGAAFFIKATVLKEISQFDFKKFVVSDSWVNFITDNDVIFSVRLIRGKAIDYYKKVFDGFSGGTNIDLPEGLREVIEGASVMAPEDDHTVWLSFKDGKVSAGTQSNRGWIEKDLEIKYDSEATEFTVDASSLLQILGMPLKAVVGDKKSYFESGNFKHVLIHKMEG
jgi:DNA polymerase III sliding clamp (beta) subunit (PCNA family)